MVVQHSIRALALSLLLTGALGNVYLTDYNHQKVVELRGASQPCLVYTDRKIVEKMLRGNGAKFIQKMSATDLDKVSASCRDTDQINKRGGFIYPGTLWCGPGNIANSYSELGPLVEEDKCCREHDHCPNQLEPGQCRQGICNISPFTRSHCDCDNAFRRCLRQVNSDAGNTIGTLYFNIVQVTCFKDRRPCPPYMRMIPSFTWFCEEWKFEPSGEFNSTLLVEPTHKEISTPIEPDHRLLQSQTLPTSTIDKNLQNLFEPNADQIMGNPKPNSNVLKPSTKETPSVLNSIEGGKTVWRD